MPRVHERGSAGMLSDGWRRGSNIHTSSTLTSNESSATLASRSPRVLPPWRLAHRSRTKERESMGHTESNKAEASEWEEKYKHQRQKAPRARVSEGRQLQRIRAPALAQTRPHRRLSGALRTLIGDGRRGRQTSSCANRRAGSLSGRSAAQTTRPRCTSKLCLTSRARPTRTPPSTRSRTESRRCPARTGRSAT